MIAEIETRRAENRALMPATTAIFDHVTAVFGPGCKVLYATENGRTIGNPAHAHRRGGADAIPGWPATHRHAAFLSMLVSEWLKRCHRLPHSGDAAWVDFANGELDKRFASFATP